MAVENRKATAVTNADAAPSSQFNNMKIDGGRLKERVGTIELANGDSIASVNRFCRVSSGDRISRVLLSSDAVTSAAGDVGIYETAANGGGVVDADFFASAHSLASAQVNVDITHEADPADAGAGFGLADVEKPLWQALGLSADPKKQYDVVLTLTAAAAAAGTVALKVQYVDGN